MTRSISSKFSKDNRGKQVIQRSQDWAQPSALSGPHAGVVGLQRAAGNRAVNKFLLSDNAHSFSNNDAVPSVVFEVLRSPGEPLDSTSRAFMESRFDHDFNQVRVHTDLQAAGSARTINAQAYTIGKHIIFGAGRYAPHTTYGKRLLAHELTHVVQQERSFGAPTHLVSRTGDAADVEASRFSSTIYADASHQFMSLGVRATPTAIVQRQEQKDVEVSEEEGFFIREGQDIIGEAIGKLLPLSNRAQIFANRFAINVLFATQSFREHANSKIEKLEGEFTAGDLVNALAGAALGPIGKKITGRITSKLGKKLVGAIFGKLSQEITDKAKDAFSNDDDIDALKAVVKSLEKAAKVRATNTMDDVKKILDPFITRLNDKLRKTGYENLTDEELRFVDNFVDTGPSEVDPILESEYGVPSESSSKEIQVQLFEQLVFAFETKHVLATASKGERIKLERETKKIKKGEVGEVPVILFRLQGRRRKRTDIAVRRFREELTK